MSDEVKSLDEVRCWRCGRLLGKKFVAAKFEIKCDKCSAVTNEKKHAPMRKVS